MRNEIILGDRIQDSLNKLAQARQMKFEAKRDLMSLVWECKGMSIQEAYSLGLIKFNFPTDPGMLKALKAEY